MKAFIGWLWGAIFCSALLYFLYFGITSRIEYEHMSKREWWIAVGTSYVLMTILYVFISGVVYYCISRDVFFVVYKDKILWNKYLTLILSWTVFVLITTASEMSTYPVIRGNISLIAGIIGAGFALKQTANRYWANKYESDKDVKKRAKKKIKERSVRWRKTNTPIMERAREQVESIKPSFKSKTKGMLGREKIQHYVDRFFRGNPRVKHPYLLVTLWLCIFAILVEITLSLLGAKVQIQTVNNWFTFLIPVQLFIATWIWGLIQIYIHEPRWTKKKAEKSIKKEKKVKGKNREAIT